MSCETKLFWDSHCFPGFEFSIFSCKSIVYGSPHNGHHQSLHAGKRWSNLCRSCKVPWRCGSLPHIALPPPPPLQGNPSLLKHTHIRRMKAVDSPTFCFRAALTVYGWLPSAFFVQIEFFLQLIHLNCDGFMLVFYPDTCMAITWN